MIRFEEIIYRLLSALIRRKLTDNLHYCVKIEPRHLYSNQMNEETHLEKRLLLFLFLRLCLLTGIGFLLFRFSFLNRHFQLPPVNGITLHYINAF